MIDARWRASAGSREQRDGRAVWTPLGSRCLAPGETMIALGARGPMRPERRIITYCSAGISASLTRFALHLAGFPNLALYDGSWEELGTDERQPIKRDL